MYGLGNFLRDDKGAVTIEFTVLVPFFIFMLVIFADFAAVYLTHTEMYNVARDAARRMSTGELKNADEVVAYAGEHMYLGQRIYTVATNFGPDGNMQVLVEVPVAEAAFFGVFLRPLIGESLTALATVSAEPGV